MLESTTSILHEDEFFSGMTEHGLIFMQNERCKNSESVGHIVPNAQVKLVETETNRNLGVDEQGEICCKSPMLTTGYYNNPQATAETIDKEGTTEH